MKMAEYFTSTQSQPINKNKRILPKKKPAQKTNRMSKNQNWVLFKNKKNKKL